MAKLSCSASLTGLAHCRSMHEGGLLAIGDLGGRCRAEGRGRVVCSRACDRRSSLLHLTEIGLYTRCHRHCHATCSISAVSSATSTGADLELLYFSAETYTSLGFGDIIPSGPDAVDCAASSR